LPLVNRNFTEILGLTAGTNTDIVDATQLGAGSQEIRANGARSGDNNFMLNGVDANSYSSNMTAVTGFGGAGIAIPAPDTIQEFKVQTSLYDAQYGRGAGANVNVETRSGTAEFHGTPILRPVRKGSELRYSPCPNGVQEIPTRASTRG
jgi:outer membrane receptor protein involved in Fe transport